MGDSDSCSSRASEWSPSRGRERGLKAEVFQEVKHRLKELEVDEAAGPGFEDELWAHFCMLPLRYALDVNTERAMDVLMHKKLLHMARDPLTRPAVEVRLVQFMQCRFILHLMGTLSSFSTGIRKLQLTRQQLEVTISTKDKTKLLSGLTCLMSEIGLNIREAHAFCTIDGYSLDVFVVDGWEHEGIEELRDRLVEEILSIEKQSNFKQELSSPMQYHVGSPLSDVWEIDFSLLKFKHKIASGSNGDLFKGVFRSQDVAIKVLRTECLNGDIQREFTQEVYILRKVRHKNVVQFIGACTRPPILCVVIEFMPGGSVYDFLHKQKGVFKLPALLRVAIDVSKGMTYLHQNNIIHRDIKAANLLMDENEVVKIADFGIARVQHQSGIMTAETGTYRWMAPEVIGHKPYSHKADVFSFGVVLWELLTGKLPYANMTPLQAAVSVVQQGLRPAIPRNTHPLLVELLEKCWQQEPSLRPEFSEITGILQCMTKKNFEDERATKRRNIGESYQGNG
ncbi:serine/threonine-protein kinase STY46-like isoform X2 [Henckelia pumila]|uniref:serine/threonine-protein kinase STY46-like isoform X2 n=2 Tax=Henckelia pumila TaxID=405737 RepID=UPI003C6E9010